MTLNPYFPPSSKLDEILQRIADALFAAEGRTGIRADGLISVITGAEIIGINTHVRRAPELRIGHRFLTHSHKWTQDDLEGNFLHEFGHQYYAPLMDRFGHKNHDGPITDITEVIGTLNQFRAGMGKEPDLTAARVVDFYGSADAFLKEFRQLNEDILKQYNLTHIAGLRDATDTQMASWITEAQHHLENKGNVGKTPLNAYASLPRLSRDSRYCIDRLRRCMKWDRAPSLAAGQTSAVMAVLCPAFDETLPLLNQNLDIFAKMVRGEELLCDDFALMHMSKPRVLNPIFVTTPPIPAKGYGDVVRHMGNLDIYHPPWALRTERMEALVARLEKEPFSPQPKAPSNAAYSEWVSRMAASPSSTYLS